MSADLSFTGSVDPSDKNYYNLTVSNLLPATEYNLQFQWIFADAALNTKVGNNWSNIYKFTTAGRAKPSSVTNLAGTWTSKGALKVSFTHDTGLNSGSFNNTFVSSYKIVLVSGGISKTYTQVANKSTTTQEWQLDSLTNKRDFGLFKSQFIITVTAIDFYNTESTPVTITSDMYGTPLSAPIISVTPGENSYNVSWNTQDEDILEGVYIEEVISDSITAPAGGYTFKKKSIDNPITVSANTSKRWVRAYFVDANGSQSAYSNIVSVKPTSADASDVTPPTEPGTLSGVGYNDSSDPSGNTGYIILSWTASSSPDVKTYTVKFGRASNDLSTYITFNGTSGRLDNLRSGVTYYFQIAANDGVNDSGFIPATPVAVTVPGDTTAPVAPTGLVAVAGFNNIVAYWSRNSESDVDLGRGTYQFQLSTSSTFATVLQTQTITGTVATFTGLTTGTTYYVRVRAIDSSGNIGPYSSTANATPGTINAQTAITSGTIVGDLIAGNTIVGDKIIANTLDADRLKTNSIITGKINVGGAGKVVIDGTAVDPAIYIGTGTYANANTPVYLANSSGVGRFSLGDKLTWNGSTLSVTGGFTVTGSSYITTGELGVTGATASIFAGADSGSGRRVKMTLNGLFGYDGATEVFSISNNTGNAVFNKGTIAGWDVTGNQITKNGIILDSANGYVSVSTTLSSLAYSAGIDAPTSTSDIVLWAGQTSIASRSGANFRVDATGKLFATGADINGTFFAGNASSTYLQANTSNIVLQGRTTNVNNWSDVRAYSGGAKIIIDATSGVSIYGIPTQGDIDMTDYSPFSYRYASPLGGVPRQRMLVEDPVTGQTLLGMGVYYGQRTNAPGASTGRTGDLWVSWA